MKKIISILLTLILLFGSIGLTYGTHYCGGHAVISEVMLGHKHLDCGMGMMEMPTQEDGTHVSRPGCCDNQYVSIETDDTVTKRISLELEGSFVTELLPQVLYVFDLETIVNQPVAADSSPPLPNRDFTILHQVFRI